MPTPYPFVSGATLLASQMNSLSQLPTVSITSNSTAVATHAYSRVIANGSAISYTIPNSVFEAGQVIEFHNINSTACTIAAGAGVTLNGAAGLTVAQYQSATIYATSASSFILFESDVTASTGGLELVKTQTIGSAVSSVTVSDVFSSTYDDYVVRLSAGAASTSADLNLTFGATTTGYYWSFTGTSYANAAAKNGAANAASIVSVGNVSSNGYSSVIDIQAPNLAKNTVVRTNYVVMATDASTGTINGYVNNTTAYTAFTLTVTSGTLTGGTIYVYGYKK